MKIPAAESNPAAPGTPTPTGLTSFLLTSSRTMFRTTSVSDLNLRDMSSMVNEFGYASSIIAKTFSGTNFSSFLSFSSSTRKKLKLRFEYKNKDFEKLLDYRQNIQTLVRKFSKY